MLFVKGGVLFSNKVSDSDFKELVRQDELVPLCVSWSEDDSLKIFQNVCPGKLLTLQL